MQEIKLNGESMNIVEDNIEKLKTIFPDVFTEGKVDFEKLQGVLGNYIETNDERYNFTWAGKQNALRLAQTPSTGTLRPCKEESKDWDTTQNLYIEGDNLEVLKLLQKSYHNKIKMIYIDPPYNTGNDFVYKDDFKDNIDNYKKITGQVDEEGNKISSNSENSGLYHTNWLNMMYPRLRLARNLLSDDGAIFISIDDNEVTNLTKICDEIFGADNRVALICHKSRASVSNDKIISPNHNIVLFYAKNINVLESMRKNIGLDPILDGFDLNDNDGKGEYRLVPVDGPGGAKKGNPYFEFLGITGYWRFSLETMNEKYKQGLIVKNGNSLYQKYFKTTAETTRRTATTWWDDGGLISTATSKLKQLMGKASFDTPKPLELIERMLKMLTFNDNHSIILDFFAGSSTTAHAVMNINSEYGGSRKFIMIQLPEKVNEKSEAFESGYRNICEIGIQRIDIAGDKIKEEIEQKNKKLKLGEEPKKVPDIGFKVFKLDSSNIKKWNANTENLEEQLQQSILNQVAGRSELDVVYEIMLKCGLDLTYPIEEIKVENKTLYSVGAGAMFICMDDNITQSIADKIISIKEENEIEEPVTVFKDNGFVDDSTKTNIKESLRVAGIKDFITV